MDGLGEGGRCTALHFAKRQVTAAAGKDKVAYFRGNEDQRSMFMHRLLVTPTNMLF